MATAPIRAATAGVFYNYGTNATSNETQRAQLSQQCHQRYADVERRQFGPAYVAWTAPTAGTITVNTSAWDPLGNSADFTYGCPSFYVVTSTLGPAAPILSASSFVAAGGTGSQYFYGTIQSQPSTTIPDSTITDLGQQSGYASSLGLNWTSGQFSVSAGEVLYFVSDPGHNQAGVHGNHSTGDLQDSLAVQAQVSYTPEPSSIALLGTGVAGLVLSGWRRGRREPGRLRG